MELNLNEKLAKINASEYPEKSDRDLINEWKDRVPMLQERKTWRLHPLTVGIAEQAKKLIDEISIKLINDEEMSEIERKALQKAKKIHEFYLREVERDPTEELESIERAVNLELKSNG